MNGIPERGVEGGKEVGRRRHGWLAVVGEKKGAPSRAELISPSLAALPLSHFCALRGGGAEADSPFFASRDGA